jgi:hypothetical protein
MAVEELIGIAEGSERQILNRAGIDSDDICNEDFFGY